MTALLTGQAEQEIPADLRPLLHKPLSAILTGLKGSDRHGRGLAVEALAFKLVHPVNLTYVTTRVRGTATGGTEAAFIFERPGLAFERWQVQCKHDDRLSLDDVAKEVGYAGLFKSDTVVMISTGEIDDEVRRYSDRVMATTSFRIVLVDGSDIDKITTQSVSILDLLERDARHTRRLKNLDPYTDQTSIQDPS